MVGFLGFWVCTFSSDGQTDPSLLYYYYPPNDDISNHPTITTTTGREVTLGGGLPRKMCTVALICDEKI